MAEYLTRDLVETVALNTAIPFIDSIPCNKGYVYHQNGTGIFILRGIVNNPTSCFARYNVVFTGNIAIPEGGDITPIATAIVVSGEERTGSRSIVTPAAVDEYFNVSASLFIDVPAGCCTNISVKNTSDQAINVQNANIIVERVAQEVEYGRVRKN